MKKWAGGCAENVQENARKKAQKDAQGKTRRPSFLRSISLRLAAALVILSAGYILFEYRLFGEMLFPT